MTRSPVARRTGESVQCVGSARCCEFMPRSSLPLVTVVTPTCNRAHLLDATISSVLSQDYPAVEYIVLDDGSTDATPSLLAAYEGVTAVRHPNMGEPRTVNRGLEMARGEIIGVLNDDDLLMPGAVREAVAALTANPDVCAVYPDYVVIDERSAIVGHVTLADFDDRMMLTQVRVPGPGAFFRRDVLRRVGLRDPRFHYVADCEFWFRVGVAGRMARLPRTLASYRVHGGSTSVEHAERMMAELLMLVDHVFDELALPPPLARLRRETMSNVLALMAAVVHRRSYVAALPYYVRSLAVHPLAWSRWPPRTILGRIARMLIPHPVLAPPLAYGYRRRAEQYRRHIAIPIAAAQPG